MGRAAVESRPRGWVSLRYVGALITAVCLIASETPAQEAMTPAFSDAPSSVSKGVQVGSLIIIGAAGAHLIGSPETWTRTWPHFGYRVADQTGFYLVQNSTAQVLGRALEYRPDRSPCPREALVGCALTATFTAFDRDGHRRINVPFVASLLLGTGISLIWRPERHDSGKAWTFIGTRLGIATGGYVAEKILLEGWARRSDR